MGAAQNQPKLHIAREHRGGSRAAHAERGEAELAIDKKIVEGEIDENRRKARLHRQAVVAGDAQYAYIRRRKTKRRQAEEHDAEIVLSLGERERKIAAGARLVQERADERIRNEREQRRGKHRKRGAEQNVEAQRMPDAVIVAAAEKLRAENARAAAAAEKTEVIYKEKLVDDGYARHRFRADAPDHKVIEQIHERRYGVLKQQRQSEHRDQPVKVLVSDKFLHRFSGKKCGVSGQRHRIFRLYAVRRTPPAQAFVL